LCTLPLIAVRCDRPLVHVSIQRIVRPLPRHDSRGLDLPGRGRGAVTSQERNRSRDSSSQTVRFIRRVWKQFGQNASALRDRAVARRSARETDAVGRSQSLDDLSARLAKFDGIDLAAGLGGLMLLFENADRLARLEAA